jgi:hypothetical protein
MSLLWQVMLGTAQETAQFKELSPSMGFWCSHPGLQLSLPNEVSGTLTLPGWGRMGC